MAFAGGRGMLSAGLLSLIAVTGFGPTTAGPSAVGYTLAVVSNGMQLRTPDGRVVFDYLTSKPANSGLTSPSTACFHPLNTPSGERVTALAPDDHPHHRGMYLAWHDAEFRQPIAPPRTPDRESVRLEHHQSRFLGMGSVCAARGPGNPDRLRPAG